MGYLVIKNLSFFPEQCALNSAPVIDALLRSARDEGIRIQDNSWDADAVLIWSVLWHGRMRHNQKVYEHYRRHGRPIIIAEVGALKRNHTWKIAIGNVTADGYYGHQQDLDADRPRKLGLIKSRERLPAPHVLIACQHSHSLQMAAVRDQNAWISQAVAQTRQHTDRPVIVRPHPRSPLSWRPIHSGVTVQVPCKTPHSYDDFDLDLACHAVININSGPGIQAAIAGTPVIVDRSSLAAPMSISIQDIEHPPERDRDQWLIEISHTEYAIPEIEQGLWLKRLRSRL